MDKPDINQRQYPEDERLRKITEEPERYLTREEWEREESAARQAAHKKHQQVQHDREVQQKADKKKKTQHRDWKKILLWGAVGIAVLALIFFIGWLPHHSQQKKAAEAARKRETEDPEVEVTQITRTNTPGQLTVPGSTAALTEAFIYARANGYLRKRYVDIGDHVKKGQVLALIDAPDLDAQVDQARQQLRQAEAQEKQQEATLALNKVTWDRWRVLVAKGVFSRQDGDQREADYLAQAAVVASAQRNIESFRANLDRAIALQSYERVTSPFDGIVTQRNSDVGALVGTSGAAGMAPMESQQQPTSGSANVGSSNTSGSSGTPNQSATPNSGQGGPIFAVAQIKTLRILVSVPEGYAQSVVRGMPAKVFIQERPGKPVDGTVTRAAQSIDQNSRTMLAEVDIQNPDESLFPGMYSVVTFTQIRGVAPLVVPGDAIVVRQDKTSVAIIRDEKVKFVPVEIGRDYGPSVEILSGLQAGDWLVTTVTDSVQPGQKVRPKKNEKAEQNASGQGGEQTNKSPDAGPNQYGDQSIVNSSGESTNQQGKPGQSKGQGQKSGGQQKQGGSGKKGSQ